MERKRTSRELLEEYATVEYILLGDLPDLLEEPADEMTRQRLRAVQDTFLQTLPRQYNSSHQRQHYHRADVPLRGPRLSADAHGARHNVNGRADSLASLRRRTGSHPRSRRHARRQRQDRDALIRRLSLQFSGLRGRRFCLPRVASVLDPFSGSPSNANLASKSRWSRSLRSCAQLFDPPAGPGIGGPEAACPGGLFELSRGH